MDARTLLRELESAGDFVLRARDAIEGRLIPDGRRARVLVEGELLRFGVQVEEAHPLVVWKRSLGARITRVLLRSRGGGLDDALVALKGEDAIRGRRGLARAIERAFARFGLEKLEIVGSGELVARVAGAKLMSGDPTALVFRLSAVAMHFDRMPLVVKVLGGERRALGIRGEGAVCVLSGRGHRGRAGSCCV